MTTNTTTVLKQVEASQVSTAAPTTGSGGGALPRRNSMLAAMTTDLLGADDASLLAADDYTHIYETPKYLRREKAATLRLGVPGVAGWPGVPGGARGRSAIQYGVLANLDGGSGAASPQDGAMTAPRHHHHHHPVQQQQQQQLLVRRQNLPVQQHHPHEMPAHVQYASRTMPRGLQSAMARRSDASSGLMS